MDESIVYLRQLDSSQKNMYIQLRDNKVQISGRFTCRPFLKVKALRLANNAGWDLKR